MRATKATVTFDFSFRYVAPGGIYIEANSVTVAEPGFADLRVFRQMQGYMTQVVDAKRTKLLKSFTPEQFAEITRAGQAAQQTGELAQAQQEAAQQTVDITDFAELGTDGYSKFCEYVQTSLTNRKSLAWVGPEHDMAHDSRAPLTLEVWNNIVEKGGVRSIDRVLEAFLGFFLVTPAGVTQTTSSPTSNGDASTSSSPQVLASSTTHPQRRSQSAS